MNRTILHIVLAAFIPVLLLTGCTDEDVDRNTAQLSIDAGWISFEEGNYQEALNSFEAAASIDSDMPEARIGMGWSKLRLELAEEAVFQFHYALQLTPGQPDAQAGIIAAAVVDNNFELGADQGADFTALHGDSYVFEHDENVTSRAIRILYALSAYYIGDYAAAEAEVVHIDPTIVLDSTAPSYRAELLEAIESLM